MNKIPEIASHWRGRILIQVACEKTENPEMKLRRVSENVIEEAKEKFTNWKYEIKAEISQGICLPGNEKYRVKIKIGELELKTGKPKKYKNGFCFWNTRFDEKIFECPYRSLENMADVIVYLMDDDDPICYYRAKATEFANPNAEMKWVALTNDKSVDKVSKYYKAGMISFRLSIHDQTNNGDVDWDFVPAWTNILPDEPNQYPIRAHIYQCKELPPSDDNGTSDPYVKVWSPFKPKDSQKDMVSTEIVYDNNNPIFYETVESFFYSVDVDSAPPVVLEIYDHDSGAFDSDDFIGRAVIDLATAAVSEDDEVKRPKWHPVKLGFGEAEPTMGQILVSFSVLSPEYEFAQSLYDIRLRPECEEYEITINVLGLRDLESPGILPIRKPFIKFILRSLLPPNRAHGIENIQTQPSATGANPTISTVIKFSVYLPSDPLYCPSLTCGVYDYIFKGNSQPLVGNFVIPIGNLQHFQDDLFKSEDEKTLRLIRSLDRKIEESDNMKAQLKNERHEAEIEAEKEEDFEKVQMDKEEQNKREVLAMLTPRIGKEERKEETLNIEDIELGLIRKQGVSLDDEITPEVDEKENALRMMKQKGKLKIITICTEDEKEDVETEKNQIKNIMEKKIIDKERSKNKRAVGIEKMFKQMKYVGKNVVYPTYHFDERLKIHREDVPPPKDIFLAIGFDPKYDSKQKHYRRYYEDELENIKEVIPKSPFQSFSVMRGQSRGLSKGWFSYNKVDEAGQVTNIKQVGEFKGIVSVVNKDREEGFNLVKETRVGILKQSLNTLSQKLFQADLDFDYSTISSAEGKEVFSAKLRQLGCENLQIQRHFSQMNYQAELARLMMVRTKCLVRIYILDADELPPKDTGGSVDPYLVLKMNGEVIKDRDNYQKETHNPDIYKMFEFQSEFPGCSSLKIQMWDYDSVFGDDFIGETLVDLEDRFFSPEWQSIKNKPIELRQLYHKSTKVSQGVIKCWIEILPSEAKIKENIPWNISPRPNSDFVVRLVVWDTKEVKIKDWEGTSDIYCRAFFTANKSDKRTDIHYRSMDGKGSFNYRMLFDVKNPSTAQRINLQVWDADLFSGNDFLGDSSLNLALPIEDATLTDKPIHLNKKYYNSFLKDYMGNTELIYHDEDSFWVDMKDKDGNLNGKMRIQISIVPKEHHENNENSEARSEPNHSPYLPPPIGRMKFSWNPWTMLNQ